MPHILQLLNRHMPILNSIIRLMIREVPIILISQMSINLNDFVIKHLSRLLILLFFELSYQLIQLPVFFYLGEWLLLLLFLSLLFFFFSFYILKHLFSCFVIDSVVLSIFIVVLENTSFLEFVLEDVGWQLEGFFAAFYIHVFFYSIFEIG